MILAREALLVAQILVDALRRQPLLQLPQDGFLVGMAQAA
jgi:hypothetical protein